ncbi:S-adenosyl-L-methionine-dependent methyltransferase [Lophiostoma macrostomum CBS 122681]|uniref:S-adenosyl-L-methionine-dependent methyltransferase n=1 Tax=Lophiostoma macrostomum CBS 122681 TaxID=1314788 RepID=A0A6A6SL21_9PLEO|nr:S-adenosyl-L-methionine-dependent methyltransferase [Lophiostoma macrostomum CBS 122681]
MEPSNLSILGRDVQATTERLYQLLSEPQESSSSWFQLGATSYSGEVQDVRGELLDKVENLRALVLGPHSYIYYTSLLSPAWLGVCNALYHFKIASHVPVDQSISYKDLSELCGLHLLETARIVKAAISMRIFTEDSNGHVKHNALSAVIAEEAGHNSLGFFTQEFTPAALKLPESLERFPRSDSPGESALAISNGGAGDRDIFTMISHDYDRVERFAKAMSFGTMVAETSLSHFVDNVPWSSGRGDKQEACPRTVVDVGGSRGDLCEALLRKYPRICHAIVEDRPETTKSNVACEPASDISDRITYQAYDFFTEQPVKTADVFIFRTILHDWPDSYAIQILRNQIPALKSQSRILINDICIGLPSSNTFIDQARRAHDIFVKMGLNAAERSVDDWTSLLRRADERFELVSVVTPSQSVHSIIEVAWRDLPDAEKQVLS